MDLARPVLLTALGPWNRFHGHAVELQVGDTTIRTLSWTSSDGCILLATHPFVWPEDATDISTDIEQATYGVDGALRLLADALTVSTGSRVQISSISPTFGLLPGPDELTDEQVIELDLASTTRLPRIEDPIELVELVGPRFIDRLEGLSLLAEAMSHSNHLGRFAQLVRLLEAAFGRGAGKFDAELHDYLSGEATRHWFTRKEINQWITSRPRASHADRPDRPIYYEHDVAGFVDRLHEAAVDVLFNKENWNSCDSARRNGRVPRRGSLPDSHGFFVTQGDELSVGLQIMDTFGSFPLLLADGAERCLPPGWWAIPDGESMQLHHVDDWSGSWPPGLRVPQVVANGPMLVYGRDDRTVRSLEDFVEAP